ncbi:MAG: lipoyl(octanoyl) transferase LipB [Bdellovibrionota bacterium]|nr:lipoyl(octanoyl) transferase LipB [Pseudomonadota bacterium]MDY6090764.1 lipoyl(octanoyl) transferase LipB [Bdellovibrionota bacterium]
MQSNNSKLKIFYLKNYNYKRIFKFQNACRENLLKAQRKSYLLIVEHQNVITFGKNKILSDLLVSKEYLNNNNIEIFESNRGGKVTAHGIGQLVFYPIINLKEHNLNIRDYVHKLENILINTLKYFNIDAKRDDNMEGVFVYKNNILQKIGFIGVHVKKYHTMHGISVNIYNDILNLFNLMNPCGFNNLKVTSIEGQINKKISYDLFIKYFINEFNNDFNF